MIILEKYLNDLKSRLPFLKKKVVDEEDDESEFVEEDKTRVSIGATGTDVVSDEDNLALSENDEDGDDESTGTNVSIVDKFKNLLKPKKKNTKSSKDEKSPADKKKANIIRGIIVVAIVILIAQEFFPSEEDTASAPSLALKPREKPKKKKEVLEPAAPVDATTPTTPTSPADTSGPTVTTTAPVDTVSQPEVPTPVETTPPSTGDVSATPEVPSPNETTVTPETSPVTVTTEETPNTSPTTTEAPVIVNEPSSPDSVDGQTTDPDENLTDKILQDLENQAKVTEKRAPKTEYTTPPDYEYKGRGLVYNCQGKHWACVDAPSYQTCEDNSSSTKFLKRSAECYPFNVYESQKGCEMMQNRMVSSSAKTDFCKE